MPIHPVRLKLTRHAQQRWKERFPHLDPEEEWASRSRASKKVYQKVKRETGSRPRDGHLWVTQNGVVMLEGDSPGIIVTVMPQFKAMKRRIFGSSTSRRSG